MRFDTPWMLLLMLLVPAWVWLHGRKNRRECLMFSSFTTIAESGRTWRNRISRLPFALRVLAVLLLIVVLARPQQGADLLPDESRGIALEMVVDRSGSMGEEIAHRGSPSSRLDVAKTVFKEFILGNGKDQKGRTGDLVGVISFARYAETVCPLTLSHEILGSFINDIQLASRKEEDGTAIGDALALAVARLMTSEEMLKKLRSQQNHPVQTGQTEPDQAAQSLGKPPAIKSKVIILLTDGRNNAGKRTPEQALALARREGIRIYTLGIGGDQSSMNIGTPFGQVVTTEGSGVDEEVLRTIASETGGKFWLVDSPEKLRRIYTEIDQLEKSEIEAQRFTSYSERFAPLALIAMAGILLELALRMTCLRRVP